MPKRPERSNQRGFSSQQLATRSAELMLDKKARQIIIMDLRGLTTVTDYFVLGTGESDVQVKAIVDHLNESLETENSKPYHIEGYDKLSWVLIDCVDVVAHVFLPESREYYGLERLWADAEVSEVAETVT